MTIKRLPPTWTHLHSGDMIVSRVPLHRIDEYRKAARSLGYTFTRGPHPQGYIVTCLKSPHDKPLRDESVYATITQPLTSD